jgi:hypothetical protein
MRQLIASLIVCFSLFASAAVAQKLDYKQEQALKDVKFYLNDSEKLVASMEEGAAKWPVGDASVPIQDVKRVLDHRDKVRQNMKNVGGRFDQLPGTDAVKAQIDRYNSILERFNKSEKQLVEIYNKLVAVVNQGGGAEWKADFDRLREINQMYANDRLILTQPGRAIEVIRQIPNVRAERKRIADKYGALLQQTTPEARDMNGTLRYFDEVFGRFDGNVQAFAASAPQAIRADLDKAIEMGQNATRDKRPAWFGETGGIAQQMGFARTKLDLLTAIEPGSANVKTADEQFAATKTQIAEMAKSLEGSIIERNRMPSELYNGPDKAELTELVRQKWIAEGNGKEILHAGINTAAWERNTRWEWSSGSSSWYKVDMSYAQGFVVVKHSDDLAVAYYIWINKNHMKGDFITVNFHDMPDEEPSVIRKILMKHVKS